MKGSARHSVHIVGPRTAPPNVAEHSFHIGLERRKYKVQLEQREAETKCRNDSSFRRFYLRNYFWGYVRPYGSYARDIMLPFLDLTCLSLLLTSHVPGRSSPYLADMSIR